MNKKKMHNLIDFLLMIFPLLLIALSIFRTGDLNFNTIESYFSWCRSLDFGLSNYINQNMLGNLNTANAVVLFLVIDLMIYYLYWRFFDLVYCLFGFFIDIIKKLADKWGGVDND